MTTFGPPEHVYVENAWYDGPRIGVSDIQGTPHRFVSQFDEKDDEYLGRFLVWPIEQSDLALELEQWRIFAAWNEEYEAGKVEAASHPGHLGTNRRWDEIDALLRASRQSAPDEAKLAEAELVFMEGESRVSVQPSHLEPSVGP